MSYALTGPTLAQLDMKRITGYTLSIAINAAAVMALLMPSTFQLPTRSIAPPDMVVTFQTPPKIVPVLPVQPMPPLPVRRLVPKPSPPIRTHHEQTNPIVQSAPVTEKSQVALAGTSHPVENRNPTTSAIGAGPIGDGPLSESTLAYAFAPAPTYPIQARRMLFQGTVMLRVLVDVDGKPLQVVIERSSGHRELDQAARSQVLSRWRFEPATIQGQHRQAWARVPVTFNLN